MTTTKLTTDAPAALAISWWDLAHASNLSEQIEVEAHAAGLTMGDIKEQIHDWLDEALRAALPAGASIEYASDLLGDAPLPGYWLEHDDVLVWRGEPAWFQGAAEFVLTEARHLIGAGIQLFRKQGSPVKRTHHPGVYTVHLDGLPDLLRAAAATSASLAFADPELHDRRGPQPQLPPGRFHEAVIAEAAAADAPTAAVMVTAMTLLDSVIQLPATCTWIVGTTKQCSAVLSAAEAVAASSRGRSA